MTSIPRSAAALGLAAAIAGSALGAAASRAESGGLSLAVRTTVGWVTWWRRDAAPVRWSGEAPLANRVAWRAGAAGIE